MQDRIKALENLEAPQANVQENPLQEFVMPVAMPVAMPVSSAYA